MMQQGRNIEFVTLSLLQEIDMEMNVCNPWQPYSLKTLHICLVSLHIYYPPEIRRGEYLGLGIFLLQYFPLVMT